MFRRGLFAAALFVPGAAPASVPAAGLTQPPNVILMVLDDATFADVLKMPHVQRMLIDKGTTFERNYAPMPLCCPSRATLLTGLYPHNHHVLDNVAPYARALLAGVRGYRSFATGRARSISGLSTPDPATLVPVGRPQAPLPSQDAP